MKLAVAIPLALVSVLTSGCFFALGTAGSSPYDGSPNAAAVEPEPDYAEARAKLDAAKGELAQDPAAAERDFLAARVALFHAYADAQKQLGRPTALFQALGLGFTNVRHFGPAANEIMWRSVIGRTAALKKLGREEESLTELPGWRVEFADARSMPSGDASHRETWLRENHRVVPATKLCPESLGRACADHVTWLTHRFSEVRDSENGPYIQPDFTIARGESDLQNLSKVIRDQPDKPIVFSLTVAGRKKEKDGSFTLIRDGVELAVTSGTDTGKRRLAVKGDQVVVERIMANVQHDVVHSNSISIHLAPGQDLVRGTMEGAEILVFANLRRARATREGPRTRYHLDRPFVIGLGGIYQYGVDLKWAFPEEH